MNPVHGLLESFRRRRQARQAYRILTGRQTGNLQPGTDWEKVRTYVHSDRKLSLKEAGFLLCNPATPDLVQRAVGRNLAYSNTPVDDLVALVENLSSETGTPRFGLRILGTTLLVDQLRSPPLVATHNGAEFPPGRVGNLIRTCQQSTQTSIARFGFLAGIETSQRGWSGDIVEGTLLVQNLSENVWEILRTLLVDGDDRELTDQIRAAQAVTA